MARVKEVLADGNFSFELLGRAQMEFIKVPGGLLGVDELQRVVSLFRDSVTDQFTVHCYEESTPRGPKKRFVLHIEPRRELDLDTLARGIAEQLHLGPTFTYADGVTKGLYLPLVCVMRENTQQGKRKRIVRHW